jgi:hypothetical protein
VGVRGRVTGVRARLADFFCNRKALFLPALAVRAKSFFKNKLALNALTFVT